MASAGSAGTIFTSEAILESTWNCNLKASTLFVYACYHLISFSLAFETCFVLPAVGTNVSDSVKAVGLSESVCVHACVHKSETLMCIGAM